MQFKLLSQLVLFAISLIITAEGNAQIDSMRIIHLKEVYVSEVKPSFNTTSRDITAITNTEMKEKGTQTLSDAIATLPGVSQLTTGAISKPVIRGLFGDRVQVNMSGINIEDQEWEDESGLGISDVGVDRVELIKGPAALMFGSGAMGGVINIIRESMPDSGQTKQNLNMKLFSNTHGEGIDYGFKKAQNNSFLFRAGLENHADYSDGSGERVPNTRFALYNMNIGYKIHHNRWESDNLFLIYYDQFGFISDSSDIEETEKEPRLSREFDDAHVSVLFNMLSSNNSIRLNEATDLNIILGSQSNHRQEQEHGEEVELDLLLNTYTLNCSITSRLNHDWKWTNGIAGMFQTNKNFGSRIIVPDAFTSEGSAYSYLKKQNIWGNVTGIFESGLRYDHRQINTFQTYTSDPQAGVMTPFNKGFNIINGSLGECIIVKNLVLKFDLGTGFRSGNLAELSDNGLHEGTPNWYIGDPDLKLERCLNEEISATWRYKNLILNGSVFHNSFQNYIFLQPTNEKIYGYNIYRFKQTNAVFQGFETGISLDNLKGFNISLNYSYLNAKESDGSWIPMIPANKFFSDVKYSLPVGKSKLKNPYMLLGVEYTEAQNDTGMFENPAPSYLLLNAGLGINFRSLRFILTCNNLTNRLYYDYLSRLKYYGMFDMGRNIVLNVGWQF